MEAYFRIAPLTELSRTGLLLAAAAQGQLGIWLDVQGGALPHSSGAAWLLWLPGCLVGSGGPHFHMTAGLPCVFSETQTEADWLPKVQLPKLHGFISVTKLCWLQRVTGQVWIHSREERDPFSLEAAAKPSWPSLLYYTNI